MLHTLQVRLCLVFVFRQASQRLCQSLWEAAPAGEWLDWLCCRNEACGRASIREQGLAPTGKSQRLRLVFVFEQARQRLRLVFYVNKPDRGFALSLYVGKPDRGYANLRGRPPLRANG